MYEVVIVGKSKTESGFELIKRTNDDGSVSWIPFDEGNSDYQQYLIASK